MIGFAYFNRPVARLFLGDVGSLPIGLLLGLAVAAARQRRTSGGGDLDAALLSRRCDHYLAAPSHRAASRSGKRIARIFISCATDRGFTVTQVVARVFFVNVALAALAMWTVIAPSRLSVNVALLGGAVLVALLLFAFARGRR